MQIDPDFFKNSPRAGTSTVAPTPPAPPVVTPLKNVGLTEGWTPNYKNQILSNPAYLSWKNSANLDVAQAASARKAALRALAMQYGGLAGGFQDTYGDLDAATLDIAKNNQFSDIARLNRNYTEGVTNVKRSLAARGGLQSGELGYGLDKQNLAKASGEYDMAQQFGNTAQSVINNYLATESASRRAEQDALLAAEANVYANPANRPSEGTSASLDPNWQSYSDVPIYIGPDSRKYKLDANGNPVEWTAPGAPPPPSDPPLKPLPPYVDAPPWPTAPSLSEQAAGFFSPVKRTPSYDTSGQPRVPTDLASFTKSVFAPPKPKHIPEAARRALGRALGGF